MLTISPPSFVYPLDDLRSHQVMMLNNNMESDDSGDTETTCESLLDSPSFHHHQQQLLRVEQDDDDHEGQKRGQLSESPVNDDEPRMAKKINHNASERDRRKKINSLYSSLRSLLPPAQQEKRLSIPVTVSRVLKYIPDLQKEIEALSIKKECLMKKINSDEDRPLSAPLKKPRKCSSSPPLSAVSATHVNDREVMIQIATMKLSTGVQGEVLSRLEEEYGLLLLNSSCFESLPGRVFYNLHLEVCGGQVMDMERVRKQLLSLYENREEPVLLSNIKSIGQIADIFVNK